MRRKRLLDASEGIPWLRKDARWDGKDTPGAKALVRRDPGAHSFRGEIRVDSFLNCLSEKWLKCAHYAH